MRSLHLVIKSRLKWQHRDIDAIHAPRVGKPFGVTAPGTKGAEIHLPIIEIDDAMFDVLVNIDRPKRYPGNVTFAYLKKKFDEI